MATGLAVPLDFGRSLSVVGQRVASRTTREMLVGSEHPIGQGLVQDWIPPRTASTRTTSRDRCSRSAFVMAHGDLRELARTHYARARRIGPFMVSPWDVAHSDRLAPIRSGIVRKGSRKVVFVSDHLKDHLAPRLRLAESQCVVIPNGVDLKVFPSWPRSFASL